jgi:hypothetical protein
MPAIALDKLMEIKALDKVSAFDHPRVEAEKHLVAVDIIRNENRFYDLYLEVGSKMGTTGAYRVYRTRVVFGKVGEAPREGVMAQGASKADAVRAYDSRIAELTAPGRTAKDGTPKPVYTEAVGLIPASRATAQHSAVVQGRAVQVGVVGGAPAGTKILPVAPKVLDPGEARKLGHFAPGSWDPKARSFFDILMKEATVKIQAGMQVSTVSAAGLMTPLGIVDDTRLGDALGVLADIEQAVRNNDTRQVLRLNDRFFRLVPHAQVGSDMIDTMLTNAAEVDAERQILQTARTVIQAHTSKTVLPVELIPVEDKEMKGLTALLRDNLCTCSHHQSEMRTLAPVEAYRVVREGEKEAFVARRKRPEYATVTPTLLMHGTTRSAAAGILTRGLMPRSMSGNSNGGSVYGDGIYFAANSGKALGYVGGASKGQRVIFAAYILMARPHVHNGRVHGTFSRQSGTDGVHAKGGADLLHDEWIVDEPSQTALAYVLVV